MALRERGYERQVGPGGLTPRPFVSPESFGAGVGREVERFGARMEQAAQESERIDLANRYRSDLADASRKATDHRLETIKQLQELRDQHPDGVGYAKAAAELLDRRNAEFMPTIGNERIVNELAPQFDDDRARLLGDADEYEYAQRGAKQVNDLILQGKTSGNIIRSDPRRQTVLGEYANFAERVGYLEGPQSKKDELLRAGQEEFSDNYLSALDPDAFDKEMATGFWNGWIKPERAREIAAHNEVKRHSLAAADRERLADERRAAVTRIETVNKMVADGVPVGDDVWAQIKADMARPELELNDKAYDIGGSQIADAVNRNWRGKPPAMIAGRVAELNAKIANAGPNVPQSELTKMVLERNQLNKLHEQSAAMLKNDPLGFHALNGGRVTPLDINRPASFDERLADGRAYQKKYGGPLTVLREDELTGFADQFASGNPKQRVDLVNELAYMSAKNGGQFGIAAARQLSPKDPTLASLVALASLGNDSRAAARDVLYGPDAIAAHKGIINQKAAQETFNIIAPAFGAMGEDAKAAIFQNALNILATRQARKGRYEWPDNRDDDWRSEFKAALFLALGGRKNANGELEGGWGKHMGALMMLPTGMTQAEFNKAVGDADANDLYRAGGNHKAVDRYGNAPTLLAFKRMTFEPIADGLYRIKTPDGYLKNHDTNDPFIMDARKLHSYAPAH